MANENKTKPTTDSVDAFIDGLDDPTQRLDSAKLVELMREVTGEPAVLWGKIIGFGSYHYRSKSGREGDWMKIGFSPRKGQLSLYLTTNAESLATELADLGKHTTGKGCVYIKRLSDINIDALKAICTKAYAAAGHYTREVN